MGFPMLPEPVMPFLPRLHATLVALLALLALAPVQAAPPPERARVMLIGMFHFANPGLDMVKSRVIDVMTPGNQRYLDGLAQRLAAFRPTDVLVECSPSRQARYDAEFKDYLAGKFDLPSNENYQIGFRTAKAAGLSGITCFDEDTIGWDAEPMFDYLKAHDPARKEKLDALFASLSAQTDQEQSTLPLPRLLQLANDPARDAFNRSVYLQTNDVDAGRGFSGADAAASWWHRNFRMYANVQKAATPGRRVIVVAGQGHTAILRTLLADDTARQAEDALTYLDPETASP